MPLIEINKNPSRQQLFLFSGLLLPGFFGLLGLLIWHRWNMAHLAWGVCCAGVGIGLPGLAFPGYARVLYLGWLRAVYPVGWTVSITVLAIIYFVILTPIGFVLRVLKRPPLKLSFEKTAKSYWTARPLEARIRQYFRQY